MNITGNTCNKRGIRNGTIMKIIGVHNIVEINARMDAGTNHHDITNHDMGITRDFDTYDAIYQNSYGSSRKAYSAGTRHSCWSQCSVMGVSTGWLVMLIATVAGFGLSYLVADSIKEDNDKYTFKQDIAKGDYKYSFNGGEEKVIHLDHDIKTGDTIMGKQEDAYPEFWNWVIAGAGAILSLILATTCMYCCAKHKNKLEAKHNVVGAELAGILTERGKLGPHGVTGMRGTINNGISDMPIRGGNPMGPQPMGPRQQPMGPQPMQLTYGMEPNQQLTNNQLYLGPIDNSTRQYKRGRMVIHKPEVREEIVGYKTTEIPLKESSRSRRRAVNDYPEY